MLESIESAQFISNKQVESGIVMNIPEEKLDNRQKHQLLKNRLHVISNIKKPSQSQSRRSDYEDPINKSLFEKGRHRDKTEMQRESALQIESVLGGADSNMNTPKIFPKELISQSEQKLLISTQNMPNEKLDARSADKAGANSLFVPSNFVQTPQGNSSRSSQGSLVGRNKVFIPFLKLPENNGQDQQDIVRHHQKPDDNRFKLMKTKEQATPEIQRNLTSNNEQQDTNMSVSKQKGFGKKGKLLDIGSNTSQKNDSANNNEIKTKVFSF